MLKFIAEKSIILMAAVSIFLVAALLFKAKRLDESSRKKYGKLFFDMPFLQRQRLFFKGKTVKLAFFITAAIYAGLLLCKFLEYARFSLALALAVITSVLLTALIFELIPLASGALRRLISVNNTLLNIMLSSEMLLLFIFIVSLALFEESDIVMFCTIEICLSLCYLMMVYVLITILKEASNENSGLTLKNIWKSAVLTIVLFILNLSVMSGCCYAFDKASFAGSINSFFDIVYYTCVTFATVGYGDISPVSAPAKAVCILTIFTSIMCITVLLSEIVGLKKSDKQ